MAWAESIHEEIESMFSVLVVPTYDVRDKGTTFLNIKGAATAPVLEETPELLQQRAYHVQYRKAHREITRAQTRKRNQEYRARKKLEAAA